MLSLQAYAVTSFLFIMASICGFCAETLSDSIDIKEVTRQCGPNSEEEVIMLRVSCLCCMSDIVSQFTHTNSSQEPVPFLRVLDYICTAFFSLELFVRILFSPNKTQFFTSPMNIIDIVALLPLYVQDFLQLTDGFSCLGTNRAFIEIIFILRIIRIFRIFHILKHYRALKILVHAIRASVNELLMLAVFLLIGMLIFSTIIFYAEGPDPFAVTQEKVKFPNIPVGFWWSIITMTTVGYGDVFPESTLGCIIGMMCAISGVVLVALTIPVISNNFALFYIHARTRRDIVNTNSAASVAVVTSPAKETLQRTLSKTSRHSTVTIGRFEGFDRVNHVRQHLPIIESNSTLADTCALSPITADDVTVPVDDVTTLVDVDHGGDSIPMIDAAGDDVSEAIAMRELHDANR